MASNDVVVGNNIWNNIELIKKVLEEGFGIVVALGAIHGSNDRVAGEDRGTGRLEHRLAGYVRGRIKVVGADEGLDTVVEVEARTNKGRGRVGETRLIGVVGFWWGGIGAQGIEWGLNAYAALAATTLSSCLLGGGEAVGAYRCRR